MKHDPAFFTTAAIAGIIGAASTGFLFFLWDGARPLRVGGKIERTDYFSGIYLRFIVCSWIVCSGSWILAKWR